MSKVEEKVEHNNATADVDGGADGDDDRRRGQERILNFSAGPGRLPEAVLREAQEDMLSWKGKGLGIMEMSHRSAEFKEVISEAEADLRTILSIPDNYKVLFMQGGASGQFSGIPLNLAAEHGSVADYIVTGRWSALAMKEAQKYVSVHEASAPSEPYTNIPNAEQLSFSALGKFVYYCDNETVNGVEFTAPPTVPEGRVLVCDMSSNILTKRVDVSKYGIIYAGAQKNMGPAGVTVVIIREDLIGQAHRLCPKVLDYEVLAKAESMPNTPPCWNIYVMGLVFKWVLKEGGIDEFEQRSQQKSAAIYAAIDTSKGFYSCPVNVEARSRVTIPFRICDPKSGTPDEAKEKLFMEKAKEKNMFSLKGHSSVGGLRVALYNATGVADAEALSSFMTEFARAHTE